MEKSFRQKIADLFNDAEYDNSHYNISMAKLLIWVAVITMLSSLTPFIFPDGPALLLTFVTLITLLFTTVHLAFRWATKPKD